MPTYASIFEHNQQQENTTGHKRLAFKIKVIKVAFKGFLNTISTVRTRTNEALVWLQLKPIAIYAYK